MNHVIHRSTCNTYHPAPGCEWSVHDSQGTDEAAPSCHECGRCDCASFDPVTGHCADGGDETCEG